MLQIRQYFFRIRILGAVIVTTITDPNPDSGGKLVKDPARSVFYLDIFVLNEKQMLSKR